MHDLKAVFKQLNDTLITLAQEVQESGLLDDPEVSSIYQGLKKLTEGSGMVSSPNVLAIQTMAQLMWIKEVGPAQYLDMATKAGKVTLTTEGGVATVSNTRDNNTVVVHTASVN
jgi:hypothetical protein